MTITLELTPEQEADIQARAVAACVDPAEFVLRLIDDTRRPESITDRLARIGVLGGVAGKPRPDGRAWSEIEGYEFE